jgi:hypothetical protein
MLGTLRTVPITAETVVFYGRGVIWLLRDDEQWQPQLRQAGIPLATVSAILARGIPDLKANLAKIGFEKLLDFVRHCCANTTLGVMRTADGDLLVVLRESLPTSGELLTDADRPSSRSAAAYRVLLSAGMPSIKLPGRDAVCAAIVGLVERAPRYTSFEALIGDLVQALGDAVQEPAIKTTVQVLMALGLLDVYSTGAPLGAEYLSLRPEYHTVDALLDGLRDGVRTKLLRSLDTVDDSVLREMVP